MLDICGFLEKFGEKVSDYANELRYEMVEECGDDRTARTEWLESTVVVCMENQDYKGLAGVAALLELEEAETA